MRDGAGRGRTCSPSTTVPGAFIDHHLSRHIHTHIQSFHRRDIFHHPPWKVDGSVVLTRPALTGTAVPFPNVPSMASAVRMAVVKSGMPQENRHGIPLVDIDDQFLSTIAPAGTTPAA